MAEACTGIHLIWPSFWPCNHMARLVRARISMSPPQTVKRPKKNGRNDRVQRLKQPESDDDLLILVN